MIIYHKIVRDKIPDIIRSNNGTCKTIIISDLHACIYLNNKLKEEADELIDAINYKCSKKITEELADLQEIIIELAKKQGIDMEQIIEQRLKKKEERGGFSKNIFLLEASKKKE